MQEEDREIRTTRFWGSIIIGAILVPTVLGFVWVGSIDNRVHQNEEDIKEIKTDINSIEDDIRAILIGIEQVKSRLGIIESN